MTASRAASLQQPELAQPGMVQRKVCGDVLVQQRCCNVVVQRGGDAAAQHSSAVQGAALYYGAVGLYLRVHVCARVCAFVLCWQVDLSPTKFDLK